MSIIQKQFQREFIKHSKFTLMEKLSEASNLSNGNLRLRIFGWDIVKGAVTQIEETLINDCLRVSKIS